MFKQVSKTLLSTFALSILFSGATAQAFLGIGKPKLTLTAAQIEDIPACEDADLVEGVVCKKGKIYVQVPAVPVDYDKKKFLSNQYTTGTGFKSKEVRIVQTNEAVIASKRTKSTPGNENEEGDHGDYEVTPNGDGTITICFKTGTIRCEVKTVTVKTVNKSDDDDKPTRHRGGNVDVLIVGGGSSGSGRRSRDPRVSAKAEFQMLYDFCSGEVQDLLDTVDDDTKAKMADLDTYKSALDDANAALAAAKQAEADALKAMMSGCRKSCIELAITEKSKCYIPKTDSVGMGKFVDGLVSSDLQGGYSLDINLNAYLGGQFQNTVSGRNGDPRDATELCSMLAKIKECAAEINKNNSFDDCGGQDWKAATAAVTDAQNAVNDAKTNLADAQSNIDKLNSTESCTITRASDVARVRNCGGRKCLEKANDSCARAVADADQQLQVLMRTPYCATCGYDGGGGGQGGCQNGYGCTGVSKAAQMISAIGGVAVPLGLGFMNMAMWNKSFNACTSMYSQQLEVSKAVGLPPTAPQCGGVGMAGFGAFGSGGGLNGFGGIGSNPYGTGFGGIGGMGGYGMPGGYNPYGSGIGGGISAGIGLGFGGGVPGMYNPYAGGMYGGLGGGIGGGIGGFNPYGGGIGGGIGGGLGNPYGNVYGVQQQMVDAQMRMQQMANQNMVLQQSQMMGGMYGQMGGNYGVSGSPYFNMGSYGGVNPMMNMGVSGNFTTNPWAYSNTGGYGYNPYAYGGGGNGISGGISAGINLGFGNGYNTGSYSPYSMYSGGYPSYANSGYSGMYNSGYGPYGNSGSYGQTGLPTSTCGWQYGVQCGGTGVASW